MYDNNIEKKKGKILKEKKTQENQPISYEEFISELSEGDRCTIFKHISFKIATVDEINNMISHLEINEQQLIYQILINQIKIFKRDELINYIKRIGRFFLLQKVD